jgi:ABC-2 type transport system permease protein
MSHVAERFAQLPWVAVLVALFFAIYIFAIYPQAFWVPRVGAIAQFLLVCRLVFGLRFLMQYTF